jgi:capsular exopolysaccharide synthesis family protein
LDLAKQRSKVSITEFFYAEAPETTEFRRVLNSLNGMTPQMDKRSILITSSMLCEGKSVFASYLALTSARCKNRKTLLIDFDLRRPMIHKLFAKPIEKGISDILAEGLAAKNFVKSTSVEMLDIITAGRTPNNPSELITAPAVHRIVEEMKFYYDLILIDSPPLIAVMDPLILLEEVDGVILVIKAGSTQRDVVLRAKDILAKHKEKIAGVVVNNIDRTLPYYYDYSYYGYKYKSSRD